MDTTTEDVKKLRDETGVSVMKCKNALEEAGGDMKKAAELLQKKSKETADKKKDRTLGAGRIVSYIHNTKTVGVLLELSCETDFVAKNEEFIDLAYNIAMHVAAMNPQYTSAEEVPEEDKSSMREDFEKELSDKPDGVREKAVEGKLSSYLSEIALMEQPYIKDGDKTIAGLIDEAIQKFGERIEVTRFTRYEVGE
ncbi:MAG: elongation factor Ts [Patescibacteria group bacterium]